MSEIKNRTFYCNLFDEHWKSGRHEQAIQTYEFLGRIFERAKDVAEYYESKGQLDKAMAEYKFFIDSCPSQISQDYLPYPGGPKELFLLGKYFEKTEPLKAEKYLTMYLNAEKFKTTMGVGIDYKIEAEETLEKVRMRKLSVDMRRITKNV